MRRSLAVHGFIVLVGLGAGSLFAGACGSDDSSNAAGSSTGSGDPGCSLGGTKCAYDCTPDLGCTQCAVNADCKDMAKPACVLGQCRECGPGAGCAVTQACFPRDDKCHPKCAVNADCPADSPICLTITGTCVGCQTNADCVNVKNAPICEPNRAQCSACASNADCGAVNPACDLNDGLCHECLVDANCAAPSVCGVDRKCHPACGSNGDCKDAAKPLCDLTIKGCVACLTTTDCGATAPVCYGGTCYECVVNADCKNAATPVCKGGVCVQ